MERLFRVLRIGFGAVFVWAGWDKLLSPQAFADAVSNYKLLPGGLVNPAAVVLPWIEVGCGILLIVGFGVGGSLLVLNALLLVFSAALALSIYRGLDISCGCFDLSPDGEKASLVGLARDMGLLLAGGILASHELRRLRRAGSYPRAH